jgi:hypothetical protein
MTQAVSAAREQGKRSRDGELRGGTGQPVVGMSVEGVEAILQRNQGALRSADQLKNCTNVHRFVVLAPTT